jgi:hypothetical protein
MMVTSGWAGKWVCRVETQNSRCEAKCWAAPVSQSANAVNPKPFPQPLHTSMSRPCTQTPTTHIHDIRLHAPCPVYQSEAVALAVLSHHRSQHILLLLLLLLLLLPLTCEAGMRSEGLAAIAPTPHSATAAASASSSSLSDAGPAAAALAPLLPLRPCCCCCCMSQSSLLRSKSSSSGEQQGQQEQRRFRRSSTNSRDYRDSRIHVGAGMVRHDCLNS